MPASTRPDPVTFGQTITECSDKLALLESYGREAQWGRCRQAGAPLRRGPNPGGLDPECEQLSIVIGSISAVVASIAGALMATDESKSPAERESKAAQVSSWASTCRGSAPWSGCSVPGPRTMRCPGRSGWSSPAGPPGVPGAAHADAWLCRQPDDRRPAPVARLCGGASSAAVCTSADPHRLRQLRLLRPAERHEPLPRAPRLVVASPFDYAPRASCASPR